MGEETFTVSEEEILRDVEESMGGWEDREIEEVEAEVNKLLEAVRSLDREEK